LAQLIDLARGCGRSDVGYLFPVVVFQAEARQKIAVHAAAPGCPQGAFTSSNLDDLVVLEGAECLRDHGVYAAGKSQDCAEIVLQLRMTLLLGISAGIDRYGHAGPV